MDSIDELTGRKLGSIFYKDSIELAFSIHVKRNDLGNVQKSLSSVLNLSKENPFKFTTFSTLIKRRLNLSLKSFSNSFRSFLCNW